jgi:hypothetical protein
MNQIPICRSRTIRVDRISLRPKKETAPRTSSSSSSSSPAIKDRKGAVEEVLNKEGSKLVSPAEANSHQQTLGLREIIRAIKITDTIKRIAGRGMMTVVQGISSRMTGSEERASISIKIMEVSSTIMKKVRTIKEAPHR